jgi:uncharacterized Rossmann fold enzyme
MNVVSFYAPRPDHPYFQDYRPFLRILDESCKKYGHKHIVLTDDKSLSDEFEIFFVELPHSLMKAIGTAQTAYLKSHLAKEDTLFTGADCVLASDPAKVMEDDFDVALTLGDFKDCILNCGAMFIRGGIEVSDIFDCALERCGNEWCDDQKSLAQMFHPDLSKIGTSEILWPWGLKVKWLSVDPYNLAPDNPGHDCSHAVVVHFRGSRKNWMKDYCAINLDIGKRCEAIALVNENDETLYENVRINSARDIPWIEETPEHDRHAVLIGGGPSLEETLPEIKWRKERGQILFALNGTAKWLKNHGVTPDYLVTIDAREKNANFSYGLPANKFIFASQCSPAMFDSVPQDCVSLFNCAGLTEIGSAFPVGKTGIVIGGGITSGLTAMALVYAMGYRKIHLYGYDSSDRAGEQHAYKQDETDAEKKRLEVWLGSQKFSTGFALYKQAEAFQSFAKNLADCGAVITVHGDGLLPAIARQMTIASEMAA